MPSVLGAVELRSVAEPREATSRPCRAFPNPHSHTPLTAVVAAPGVPGLHQTALFLRGGTASVGPHCLRAPAGGAGRGGACWH